MSLYGALLTGVAGLSAQSEALSVSSANIANVDTIGYKASQTQFATVLASTIAGGAAEAGVSATPVQNVTQAGILASASSPTDLAISGSGFFVTAQSATNTANQFYTQAGDFSPDGNGNLVNSSGYYLLGYPVSTVAGVQTTSSTLAPVNVSALSGQAQATTSITLQANLQSTSTVDPTYVAGDMAAGNVQPDFTRTVNVFDSQGGSQPLSLSFVETGANTWAYEVSYQGAAANMTTPNPIQSGTVSFNSGRHARRRRWRCDSDRQRHVRGSVVGDVRSRCAERHAQHGYRRFVERYDAVRQPVRAHKRIAERRIGRQPDRRDGDHQWRRDGAILERPQHRHLSGSDRDVCQSGWSDADFGHRVSKFQPVRFGNS